MARRSGRARPRAGPGSASGRAAMSGSSPRRGSNGRRSSSPSRWPAPGGGAVEHPLPPRGSGLCAAPFQDVRAVPVGGLPRQPLPGDGPRPAPRSAGPRATHLHRPRGTGLHRLRRARSGRTGERRDASGRRARCDRIAAIHFRPHHRLPQGRAPDPRRDAGQCLGHLRPAGSRRDRSLDLDHTAVPLRRLHHVRARHGASGARAMSAFRPSIPRRCSASSRTSAARCCPACRPPSSPLLDHPARAGHDLSSLRAGTCGGADTDPALLARCAEAMPIPGIVQVYGQTEASTLIALADHAAPRRFATCGPAPARLGGPHRRPRDRRGPPGRRDRRDPHPRADGDAGLFRRPESDRADHRRGRLDAHRRSRLPDRGRRYRGRRRAAARHDHSRRRERLSGGGRERAARPRSGRRRGGVRPAGRLLRRDRGRRADAGGTGRRGPI